MPLGQWSRRDLPRLPYGAPGTEYDAMQQYIDLLGSPLPPGAAAWYRLREGSGTTAYDISGNGRHGTIENAAWSGGVLVLDGVNDYVALGALPDYGTGAFTWLIDMKTPSTSTAARIIHANNSANNAFALGITLSAISGKVYPQIAVAYSTTTLNIAASASLLELNTRYRLAFVVDGSNANNAKMYISGTECAAYSTRVSGVGTVTAPGNWALGVRLFDLGLDMQGELYAAGYFLRALSAVEIARWSATAI